MKRSLKRLLLVFISICMVAASCMTAAASSDEPNVIKDVGDGVLQIATFIVDKQGNERFVEDARNLASCFLLNKDTVLTNYSSLLLDSATRERLEEEYGYDLSTASQVEKYIKYYVMVRRDVKIEAVLVDNLYSEVNGFAVLNLEQQIMGRKDLALGDSDQVRETDNVYALGFPSGTDDDVSYYTKDDIDIQFGVISKKTQRGTVPVFQSSSALAVGTYGGPLVDIDGNVIGLNIGTADNDNYYYAVQINEIKKYLDDFGIEYTNAAAEPDPIETAATESELVTPVQDETTETPETIAEPETPDMALIEAKANLKSELNSAGEMQLDQYTEDSIAIFQSAMDNAQKALEQEDVSLTTVERALDNLQNERKNLEPKKETLDVRMIIIIAVAVAIVVILIIVIILVSRGSKKKTVAGGPYTGVPSSGPAPTPSPVPAQPKSSMTDPGATSVLTAESGATDILDGSGAVGNAYIVRKKTGEKASITSSHFAIGREMGKVNYCITDNTTVGRVHAVIIKKGADYAIIDQKSTNGTFVNNVRLTPGQERFLKNGDTLKLSDEILEFVVK